MVVDFQSLKISRSVHRVPQALFGSELFVHSGLLRTFESSALEMYYLFILTEKIHTMYSAHISSPSVPLGLSPPFLLTQIHAFFSPSL